ARGAGARADAGARAGEPRAALGDQRDEDPAGDAADLRVVQERARRQGVLGAARVVHHRSHGGGHHPRDLPGVRQDVHRLSKALIAGAACGQATEYGPRVTTPETPEMLPFVTRLWFAWLCFFRVLFDGAFAARAWSARDAKALPAPEAKREPAPRVEAAKP